jgi:hypothetical protein
MKSILTLLGCITLFMNVCAQKPVFRYPFESAPKTLPDVLVMPNTTNAKTAFLLKNDKKIDYLLTGSDFKVIANFTNTATPDKTIYTTSAVPAGFICNGEKWYNFIYDEGSKGGKTSPGKDVLLMDVIDFSSKKSELMVKHSFPEGEKVVNAFTWGNTFYMISVPTTGDAVSICYIDSTLNKTVRTYPLAVASIYNSYQTLENLLKKAAVIYPDRENDFEAATAPVKIMPQAGKIIISSDQNNLTTILAIIDLYNNRLDLKTMELDELCIHGEKNTAINSTVMGKLLFVTTACTQKMELAVYDYTTGKLQKKFESIKDDGAPSIAQGGLNAETYVQGRKKNEKSIDNTGAFIKTMKNGNCGVRVLVTPQAQYLLTIGSFKGDGALPFPGIARPETPGDGYIPVFHSINYGPAIKMTGNYSTTWFRSVLAVSNFEKVKLNLKPGPLDKLRDFISLEEKLPASIPVFTINGASLYPWYDSEAQQFTIRTIK